MFSKHPVLLLRIGGCLQIPHQNKHQALVFIHQSAVGTSISAQGFCMFSISCVKPPACFVFLTQTGKKVDFVTKRHCYVKELKFINVER